MTAPMTSHEELLEQIDYALNKDSLTYAERVDDARQLVKKALAVPSQAEPDSEAVKLAYVKRWRTIVKLPAKYADEIVEALRSPAQGAVTVSDEDWQRALDCAMSCLRPPFHIKRSELDNAMQHAFGMLSLCAVSSTGLPAPAPHGEVREGDLYKLRDLIASHFACEDECQKYPSGCGCALTAARAVQDRSGK